MEYFDKILHTYTFLTLFINCHTAIHKSFWWKRLCWASVENLGSASENVHNSWTLWYIHFKFCILMWQCFAEHHFGRWPICFPYIPSGSGNQFVYIQHGLCTLLSVDFLRKFLQITYTTWDFVFWLTSFIAVNSKNCAMTTKSFCLVHRGSSDGLPLLHITEKSPYKTYPKFAPYI